jgi:hypothetical protein
MFHVRLYRNVALGAAALGLFAVAGCSNQPATDAANQPVPQPAKASAPAKAATPKATAVSAKATEPTHVVTLPKGTAITATVGQTLASGKNHQGDSFAASLATPVKLDGRTVLPKGTHVTGKVVTVKKHELKVVLASVTVRGKSYNLATNSLRPSDKNQTKSAKGKAASAKGANRDQKPKGDNSTLSANTQLTFKLAKPVTVPVKG